MWDTDPARDFSQSVHEAITLTAPPPVAHRKAPEIPTKTEERRPFSAAHRCAPSASAPNLRPSSAPSCSRSKGNPLHKDALSTRSPSLIHAASLPVTVDDSLLSDALRFGHAFGHGGDATVAAKLMSREVMGHEHPLLARFKPKPSQRVNVRQLLEAHVNEPLPPELQAQLEADAAEAEALRMRRNRSRASPGTPSSPGFSSFGARNPPSCPPSCGKASCCGRQSSAPVVMVGATHRSPKSAFARRSPAWGPETPSADESPSGRSSMLRSQSTSPVVLGPQRSPVTCQPPPRWGEASAAPPASSATCESAPGRRGSAPRVSISEEGGACAKACGKPSAAGSKGAGEGGEPSREASGDRHGFRPIAVAENALELADRLLSGQPVERGQQGDGPQRGDGPRGRDATGDGQRAVALDGLPGREAPRRKSKGMGSPSLNGGGFGGLSKWQSASVRAVQLVARTRLQAKGRLRREIPAWYKPPPSVKDAADAFDKRQQALATRSHRAIHAVQKDYTSKSKGRAFEASVMEIRLNRYHVNEKLVDFVRPPTPPPMINRQASNVKRWRIEESIWGPRKTWTDSKGYHDHEEHVRACFELDWELAMVHHKTAQFIEKHDGPGSVEEVSKVVWKHIHTIYGMFDYYATFGASDDIIHIQNNGFKQFVDDCHLAIQGSKHCGSSHLDQLFIMVNTGSEVARALLRQEWIQCLIRITAMRHDHFASSRHERPVGFVEYSSIADDLDKLIVEQIMPRLDKRALPDLEGFRKEYCYTAEVVGRPVKWHVGRGRNAEATAGEGERAEGGGRSVCV